MFNGYREYSFWSNLLRNLFAYITSISKLGIGVFFISLVGSYFIMINNFKDTLILFDFLPFVIALGITYVFEFIYNIVRDKTNL